MSMITSVTMATTYCDFRIIKTHLILSSAHSEGKSVDGQEMEQIHVGILLLDMKIHYVIKITIQS